MCWSAGQIKFVLQNTCCGSKRASKVTAGCQAPAAGGNSQSADTILGGGGMHQHSGAGANGMAPLACAGAPDQVDCSVVNVTSCGVAAYNTTTDGSTR